MEDRFDLRLQPAGHHGLRDSVRDGGHAEDPRAAVCLRYFHRPHRWREVAPRRHPIPDLVKVVLQILLEVLDGTPSTPGAPLLALTLSYASHISCLEISNDLSSVDF